MSAVEWSPDDTKAELVEACKKLGIDANMGMLKADIVALLEGYTDEPEPEVMTSADKTEAYKADAAFTGDPKPPIPDPPKPPEPKKPKGVLGYLKDVKGKLVPLDELIKKLGPGAMKEVKDLLKQSKVTQHRKGNKFWFSV
jgi:hypothetical protein